MFFSGVNLDDFHWDDQDGQVQTPPGTPLSQISNISYGDFGGEDEFGDCEVNFSDFVAQDTELQNADERSNHGVERRERPDAAPSDRNVRRRKTKFDAHNTFSDWWDAMVAPTIGCRMRRRHDKTGKLEKRTKAAPGTRTYSSVKSLAMMARAPQVTRIWSQCGHSSHAYAQSLFKYTVSKKQKGFAVALRRTVQTTGRTPTGSDWLVVVRRGDHTSFPIQFSAPEKAAWMADVLE